MLMETTWHMLLSRQVKENKLLEEQIAVQRQAEEELRASREAFRALTDNSPDRVDKLDREVRHVRVNAATRKLFGLAPESVIGKTNRQLGIPDPSAAVWDERIREVFGTGRPVEIEDAFPAKGGIEILQTRCVPEFA